MYAAPGRGDEPGRRECWKEKGPAATALVQEGAMGLALRGSGRKPIMDRVLREILEVSHIETELEDE